MRTTTSCKVNGATYRAQILLGEFEPAEIVLEELNENARSLQLISDLNRNLCC
ncbi:hypothetical protein ACLB1S_28355 [Escherichia coli]